MANIIHLHEIFPILMEKDYEKQELKNILESKFGENVKYTNCGGAKFDFDEVLEFMKGKRKITVDNDMISLNKENLCHH